MSLVKNLEMSRDELINHIEYLENKYEPLIERERNNQAIWINDWDALIDRVPTNNFHMTYEDRVFKTYSVWKQDFIDGSNFFPTPRDWIDEKFRYENCFPEIRENYWNEDDIHLEWKHPLGL